MKTVLFVCTGNVCRSPMAEALFRRLLKGRKDVRVMSAGVHATGGQPASPHAVEALNDLSIDLSRFRSQPLTESLTEHADLIFAMTRSHLDAIQMMFPAAAEKAFLVREFDPQVETRDLDVPDPIGLGRSVYFRCRDVLDKALPSLLALLDADSAPPDPINSTNHSMHFTADSHPTLAETDPEVAAAIEAEEIRQHSNIELIASENFTSRAVREAQGSVLTNKYAEGYPGRRWYGGCENVDMIEQLAIDRAKKLFGAEHANVQPHSGAQANMAVYFATLQPGDKILTMDLAHGGHLTHGHKANFSGRFYEVIHYGVSPEDERIDYEALARQAGEVRPRMITIGASAYSRTIDFERVGKIARECGALLFADMAHIAGLVAGGQHPSPIPYADFVTTTTHKSLRGPRGGMILCPEKYAKDIDAQVFPGIQGGPLMHVIAAKAVCLHEALQPEFRDYQRQIVLNAKSLSAGLANSGYRIVSGGTDNHLMMVDLRPMNITGKDAQETLDRAGITVNKNAIPFDTVSVFKAGGIRVGTPAVTTRGMKEETMMEIADLIHEALTHREDDAAIKHVRAAVLEMTAQYPLP